MIDLDAISRRFDGVRWELNERGRRLFAAAEAMAAGYGGVSAVSRATGVARSTIQRGMAEIKAGPDGGTGRVRRRGGGRKKLSERDPSLLDDLRRLVEPATRGDPERPLLWTSKSLRHLCTALAELGHQVSRGTVASLLRELGYSLQANRKTREGADHPDRDAQFTYINARVEGFLAAGQPVISVDTKKKELVGAFKNPGREYRPRGSPEEVQVHDFLNKELGRAVPYGVYDIAQNTGWVSVGMNHDTAGFAVETIRRWWYRLGRRRYAAAQRLLITADGGGSNGARVRLWKRELQRLANQTGLEIAVSHLPPGTSKWNKIEHRLFSFITQNWRARPLVSYQVIVQLIATTTTTAGLQVHCELDTNVYPKGIVVSDEEIAAINLTPADFHG
ncbi:MAG: ISAzo13 family transposase, partial [Alphaproteobacteria bacterium]